MKALIQRVSEASVTVDGKTIGTINQGILLLLGVDKGDTETDADKLLQKVINYRIFADSNDKMNLSLKEIKGGLLVVSQFTLAADTNKGLRPSFSSAASSELAESLYEYFVSHAKTELTEFGSGRFGSDMKIKLINDGPVTFLLEV